MRTALERRQACATAKRHLSAIQAQKRRGYALSKAGPLEEKTQRYEAMAAENC